MTVTKFMISKGMFFNEIISLGMMTMARSWLLLIWSTEDLSRDTHPGSSQLCLLDHERLHNHMRFFAPSILVAFMFKLLVLLEELKDVFKKT